MGYGQFFFKNQQRGQQEKSYCISILALRSTIEPMKSFSDPEAVAVKCA